jgi:hypothetical protein
MGAGPGEANHSINKLEQFRGAGRSLEGQRLIALAEFAQAADRVQRGEAGIRLFPHWPRSWSMNSARTRSKGQELARERPGSSGSKICYYVATQISGLKEFEAHLADTGPDLSWRDGLDRMGWRI